MNSLLKRVKCKIHHNSTGTNTNTNAEYLSINPKTFDLICLKCSPLDNNLYIEDNDITETNDYKHCYKHKNSEALFYCDDCNRFLCPECFATIHKSHPNCSTIDLIATDISYRLSTLYSAFKSLQTQLASSSNQAEIMNKITNLPKHNFQVKIDSIVNSINETLREDKEKMLESIKASYDQVIKEDKDNKDSMNQLDNAIEFYNELKELVEHISDPLTPPLTQSIPALTPYKDNDLKVCLFEISNGKDIDNGFKSIMTQLKKLNSKLSISAKELIGQLFSIKRHMIESYHQSLMHSISSRMSNSTLRLKRFNHYYQSTSKYFKIDSLCLITTHSICLNAIGLCGLFPIENQSINLTYSIRMSIYQVNDVNTFDMNKDDPLMSSNMIVIPTITNAIEPIYQYSLCEPIVINKSKLHYIILTNESNVSFINSWTGSVLDDNNDNTSNGNGLNDESIDQHSLMCNNSSIKVNFLMTQGIYSDLNEFTQGIISTIYFQQID